MGQNQTKEFPYAIGERVPGDGDALWAVHDGTAKADGTPVTIFAFDMMSRADKLAAARNAFRRLKTMRHPNILRFIDGVELPNMMYMVTEHVRPLMLALRQHGGEDAGQEAAIAWGLHQLAKALSFVNGDCKLIHGDICSASVFVDGSGEWKLGGFDALVGADDDCDFAVIPAHVRYRPPEIARQGRMDKRNPPHSADSWGLGTVIWEAFNGQLERAEALADAGRIPRSLVPRFRDLTSANARTRASAAQFLKDAMQPSGFLCNPFVETSLFLEELQIKDPGEKADFFRRLPDVMDSFPPDACRHKIFPLLVGAIEYGSGGSQALTSLLKAAKWVSSEEYEKKVVPVVVRLFSSTDRALRMQLLQHIDSYGEHLKPAVVDQQVFPQVMNGFADASPVLREQTIKSMLVLAPKLSERTINNHLLRNFAKLQMDEEPGIRTNTTICLGKVAQHFSDVTRKKVLIPAFLRALRDPFPPARSAGIMSLVATQQFYTPEDIATKIVPSLSPAMLDPEKDVRAHVFSALRGFIARVDAASNELASRAQAAGAATSLSSAGTGAEGSGGDAQGWAGWAYSSVNSVAKKLIASRAGGETASIPQGISGDARSIPAAQPVMANVAAQATPPAHKAQFASQAASSRASMTQKQESEMFQALERAGDGPQKGGRGEDEWDGGDWDNGWDSKGTAASARMQVPAASTKGQEDGWDNDAWEPLEDTPKAAAGLTAAKSLSQPAKPSAPLSTTTAQRPSSGLSAVASAPPPSYSSLASSAATGSPSLAASSAAASVPSSQRSSSSSLSGGGMRLGKSANAAAPSQAASSLRASTAAPEPINWAAAVSTPAAAGGWDVQDNNGADGDWGWDGQQMQTQPPGKSSLPSSTAAPVASGQPAGIKKVSVPGASSGHTASAASGWGDWDGDGENGADESLGEGDKAENMRRRAEERRQRQLAQREEKARAPPKKVGLGAVRKAA